MVNLFFWLLGLVVLFFAAVYLNEVVARKRAEKRYPTLGRLVTVGHHRLHIHSMGKGQPTVVLDAGLGESSFTWATIQSEVAKLSRVCSYDRAGQGWSDPASAPRTYPRIAEELHTLLINAGEKPPYVLVGHSAGGFTARLFAQMYPDEMAGLVLVDPSDEDDEEWNNIEAKRKMVRAMSVEIFPAAIGLYRLLGRPAWKRMKPGAPAIMLDYAPFLVSAKSIRATVQEMQNWPERRLFIRPTQAPHLLSALPLIVITATQDQDTINQGIDKWIAHHAALAKLSTKGKQVLANCGHHIPHEQPALVVNAIQEVVQQAREAE